MIKLIDITIEDFRSITEKPLCIDFHDFTVIVGPNNCGKSNIMRALQLFFQGHIDGRPYTPEVDFPKNNRLSHRVQTKITLTVKYTKEETSIIRSIEELEQETNQKRLDHRQLKLRLSYSKKGVESWQFIGKEGARNIKKEIIQKVKDALLHSVRFKYIPVGRDSIENIQKELGEELIRTIFSGWSGTVKHRREINSKITELVSKLTPQLDETGQNVTTSMREVFHEINKLQLQLPFHDLESMLPTLTPSLKDEYETSLKAKGAGIQTSSLLFFLKYLADNHPQRHNARITFLWAIEEPESFLHPTKQRGMANVMKQFSKDVQTIITTHSPNFVPHSSESNVYIINKDSRSPFSTIIAGNTYDLAREALGVNLIDAMFLFPVNLVVEGPSDEIILLGALNLLNTSKKIRIEPSDVKFFTASNASTACSIFETLYLHGNSSATNIRLIIDGDTAGQKALQGLIERLKKLRNINLRTNHDCFQLPTDIEQLTSRRIIEILENERPAQVHISRNTNHEITKFKIHDGHKRQVASRIVELMNDSDMSEYLKLFQLIAKSLH